MLAVGALAGCSPNASPAPPDGPADAQPPFVVPGIPETCGDLDAAAVPVLPRASNDEIRQLYTDLVGEPIDADLFARWTPLAQVRGFDTMTESRIDAQTLEEQLRTTEAVASLLVRSTTVMAQCPAPTSQPPVCALHDSYDATGQFSSVQGQDCWSFLDGAGTPLTYDGGRQLWVASDPGLFIWNTGLHPGIGIDVIRRWTAPNNGTVVLRGSIFDADGGGGDGIVVDIRASAGSVFRAVIVNGGAAESFTVPLEVRRGDTIDIVVQRGGDNAYDSTGLTATFDFAETPADGGLSWDNCGNAVVQRLAARAWRRPLRPEELADLKTVFDETSTSAGAAGLAGTFVEGLQASLQAALLSPNVQYKPEFVPGGFSAAEAGFRRASRLALYFRSSFPDDDLWALASSGALDNDVDDAVLRAQAQRLLDNDGDRFVDNFGGQWLAFRAPIGAADTPLQTSMRNEAHDVFASVLNDNLPPQRLIAPGYTIVDGPLAAHYGLETGTDAAAGPVRVTTSERGGLFTQGHFLSSAASGSDFKRVIHRGVYALNRTLCSSVPMLDPATREEIATSVGQIDPAAPLGERMQLHRNTSERCLACHSQMDPLGLALERFDETGRYRETYPDGSAINNGFAFNGTSVQDPTELAAYVGGSNEFRRCVAEKLFTFGLHRAPRDEEACVVDALAPSADDEARSLHDIAIDAFVMSLHLTEQP